MQDPSLAEFLLARIAEDAGVADAAGSERWEQGTRQHDRNVVRPDGGFDWVGVSGDGFDVPPVFTAQISNTPRALLAARAAHIARHDPARVLAECEAKRRMIDDLDGYCWNRHGGADPCGECDRIGCRNLRLLALPYADHPDYQQEWKP